MTISCPGQSLLIRSLQPLQDLSVLMNHSLQGGNMEQPEPLPKFDIPFYDQWIIDCIAGALGKRLRFGSDSVDVKTCIERLIGALQYLPSKDNATAVTVSVPSCWGSYQISYNQEEFSVIYHAREETLPGVYDYHTVFRLQYFGSCHHCIDGSTILEGDDRDRVIRRHLASLANIDQAPSPINYISAEGGLISPRDGASPPEGWCGTWTAVESYGSLDNSNDFSMLGVEFYRCYFGTKPFVNITDIAKILGRGKPRRWGQQILCHMEAGRLPYKETKRRKRIIPATLAAWFQIEFYRRHSIAAT